MKRAACALALLVSSCASGPAVDANVPLDAVSVRVVAQRVTWHAAYYLTRGGVPIEVDTGREIHVPIGASVTVALGGGEFVAELAMPQLGVRDFAAPGLASHIHFRASRAGRFDVRGGEMCGLPHDARADGVLVVEAADAYRAWVLAHARG